MKYISQLPAAPADLRKRTASRNSCSSICALRKLPDSRAVDSDSQRIGESQRTAHPTVQKWAGKASSARRRYSPFRQLSDSAYLLQARSDLAFAGKSVGGVAYCQFAIAQRSVVHLHGGGRAIGRGRQVERVTLFGTHRQGVPIQTLCDATRGRTGEVSLAEPLRRREGRAHLYSSNDFADFGRDAFEAEESGVSIVAGTRWSV